MAALSSVRIYNMALAYIGAANTVESFDEATPEAAQARLWYDYCRQQTLEAYDWSFARQRQTLALSANDPPTEWLFRYQYPASCLSFRKITNPRGPDADPVPYTVEGDGTDALSILTDAEDAEGVFTANIESPLVYKKHFVEALARNLAEKIAYPITLKDGVAAAQGKIYREIIRIAPALDANESQSRPPRDAEWVRGRAYRDPYSGLCR